MDATRRVALGVLVLAVAAGALALGLQRPFSVAVRPESRAESIGFTMGTVARVVAEGPDADAAVAAVMEEMDRLTSLLDRFRPYSHVALLNASNGEWVELAPEVVDVLQEALRLAELTGGAFDPTVAPLIDLWGFVEEELPAGEGVEHDHTGVAASHAAAGSSSSPTRMAGTAPPEPEAIAALLPLVDFRGVEMDPEGGRARFSKPGQAIDLGAIAKGYGVDRAVQMLREQGVVRGLVDLGGDVYALGTRADGSPWRLGIRHPRRSGQILGVLHVSDAAVATSGDYERYFEHGGARYTHIVDPRTGWPASELASVTVVAPSGLWADALSTAAFVLGKEEGLALLERLPGVEGVLVDKELNVEITSGLQGKLDLVEGI